MTTKLIGVKDFRARVTHYARRARKGDVRFIVMHRTAPLFEIKPLSEKSGLDGVLQAIAEGRADKSKGRVYTQAQILKEFA